MELIFASNNKNKVNEIKSMLPKHIRLLSLEDIGYIGEIEETGLTLQENACIKASAVLKATGLPCFADDSGLLTVALDGRPGVKSARYAGEPVNHVANMDLLLKELKGKTNRNASFKTVICYIDINKSFIFEGEVKGKIITEKRGLNGFGYDPIFVPENHIKTFAEMRLDEKNKISHRKRALEKMIQYLEQMN